MKYIHKRNGRKIITIAIILIVIIELTIKLNGEKLLNEYTDMSEEEFIGSLKFKSDNIDNMLSELTLDGTTFTLPYNTKLFSEKFKFRISENDESVGGLYYKDELVFTSHCFLYDENVYICDVQTFSLDTFSYMFEISGIKVGSDEKELISTFNIYTEPIDIEILENGDVVKSYIYKGSVNIRERIIFITINGVVDSILISKY